MIPMNSPAKLTDRQFAILSEASQRKDRCLIPPKTVKAAAAQKVGTKLLKAGLVREIKAKTGMEAWRRDEETGQAYSLKLTDAGLKAIAADERDSQSVSSTAVPQNTNEDSSKAKTAADMAAARSVRRQTHRRGASDGGRPLSIDPAQNREVGMRVGERQLDRPVCSRAPARVFRLMIFEPLWQLHADAMLFSGDGVANGLDRCVDDAGDAYAADSLFQVEVKFNWRNGGANSDGAPSRHEDRARDRIAATRTGREVANRLKFQPRNFGAKFLIVIGLLSWNASTRHARFSGRRKRQCASPRRASGDSRRASAAQFTCRVFPSQ